MELYKIFILTVGAQYDLNLEFSDFEPSNRAIQLFHSPLSTDITGYEGLSKNGDLI